jgi:hypothetical protein
MFYVPYEFDPEDILFTVLNGKVRNNVFVLAYHCSSPIRTTGFSRIIPFDVITLKYETAKRVKSLQFSRNNVA